MRCSFVIQVIELLVEFIVEIVCVVVNLSLELRHRLHVRRIISNVSIMLAKLKKNWSKITSALEPKRQLKGQADYTTSLKKLKNAGVTN